MTCTISDMLKGRRIAKGIAFTPAMITAIKDLAAKENSSLSGFVQQAIVEYVIKEKKHKTIYEVSELLEGRKIARGVSLPTAMIAAIEDLTNKEGRSFSSFVQQAVVEYIAKENGKSDTPHPTQ